MLLGTGGLLPEPQPSMALRSAAAAAALAGGDGSGSSGSSNRSGPGAALERRRSSLEASTDLGVFELIEGGAAAVMGTAAYARPPPLSLAELNTFFDAEGEWVPAGLLSRQAWQQLAACVEHPRDSCLVSLLCGVCVCMCVCLPLSLLVACVLPF